MARHKHWSKPDAPVHGFPVVTAEQWDQAPWCNLPTLTACDRRYAEYVVERWGPRATKSKDERAKSGPVKGAEPEYAAAVDD